MSNSTGKGTSHKSRADTYSGVNTLLPRLLVDEEILIRRGLSYTELVSDVVLYSLFSNTKFEVHSLLIF